MVQSLGSQDKQKWKKYIITHFFLSAGISCKGINTNNNESIKYIGNLVKKLYFSRYLKLYISVNMIN